MKAFLKLALAATLLATPEAAFAHAQLLDASPPVGGTVEGVGQIRLHFSEGVEPRFSSVTLLDAGGLQVAHHPPFVDPGEPTILIVKTTLPLHSGAYTVNWKAVSVDTHHTQGSFNFTVKP